MAKSAKTFKIQMNTTGTMWVHSYDSSFMMIQSSDKETARVFKTLKAAENYLSKWADCGYGLNSKTAKIVEFAA